jgi:hypothetical protein
VSQGLRICCLLGCCVVFYAGAKPDPSFSSLTAEQIDSFLGQLQRTQAQEDQRLLLVSERFLGTPYRVSPLGEGPGNGIDPDPPMRFDAIDCMTLVEESMALSWSNNREEAFTWLQQIRYQGEKMEYAARKHFVMAQWLPQNQQAGFIQDVTLEVGGEQVRWIEKKLDASVWEKRSYKKYWPKLEAAQIPVGTYRLPIIPLNRLLSLEQKIPPGTVVIVVRHDDGTLPDPVGHMGIVLQKGDQVYLRHAAPKGFKKVIDEPLQNFVVRNLRARKRFVEGVNLQRVLEAKKAGEKSSASSEQGNLEPLPVVEGQAK